MAETYTGTKWGLSSLAGTPGGIVNWSFNLVGAQFYGFDSQVPGEAFRAAIRMAFDLWESIANIDFVEIATSGAQIQLGWDSIDGVEQTLGEASWLYQGAQTTHAEVAFDSSENWSTISGQGTSIYAVAVHEIGHAIGLGHSDDPASIMYPYLDAQAGPSPSDISAIQALYGAAPLNLNLVGTDGIDNLIGSEGNDTISAGLGDDIVYGLQGHDTLYGNQGADILFGGQGNDTILGGADNDTINGNKGADILQGNQGDDRLYGNEGADWLGGGQGNDGLFAGQGDDILNGGLGNDSLTGGLGSDTFIFASGQGNDIITDFRVLDGDHLDLQSQSYEIGAADDGSVLLSLSGGGTVLLQGVAEDQFSDFFVAV